MGNLLFLPFFVIVLLLARRSLTQGIIAVFAIGYFFGIMRANFLGASTYFMFDAAVFGLYVAQVSAIVSRPATRRGQELWIATIVLCVWPFLLFLVPDQDIYVR